MQYNFDTIIDRTGTNSAKWDGLGKGRQYPEVIFLGAADMDFVSPQPVIDALRAQVEHGIFGYSASDSAYKSAVIDWMKFYHNCEIKSEWLISTPAVLPPISWLVDALTEPGDKVIIQKPVYGAFFGVPMNLELEVSNNPLKFENGKYVMDYEDLEEKAKDPKAKVLILSNPHNPVGRCWQRHELERLGNICVNNGITIISDEIHSDLVYAEYTHLPLCSISEEIAMNSVVCTAPSKTFNLSGLQTAQIIIPNEELRNIFEKSRRRVHGDIPNHLGQIAGEAAYRYGNEWLSQVKAYIQENFNYLSAYVTSNIPELKVIKSEATYLAWIDARGLNLDHKELEAFMLDKARVHMLPGYYYGDEGKGFLRMNIACPRATLEEGIRRIHTAIKSLTSGI